MYKIILLTGVLMLSPVYSSSAQNLQLPNLGDVLQDTINPNRNDGRRAYEERRTEQNRREAYRNRRDDERRAYDDRAHRNSRVGSPSWSRGRDDENRGRGRGRGNGRGNGGGRGRGHGG